MENRDWTSELRWRVNGHLSKHWPAEIDEGAQKLFDRIMADIEVFGVLKAREGMEVGADYAGMALSTDAPVLRNTFPLPTRTRQVLREESDPNGGDVEWRWNGRLEYRSTGYTAWIALSSDGGAGRVFSPAPERIDLWHSLKHNPYRIEPVPAYESNPWPDEAP